MQSRSKYQRHLFEETRAVPTVRFPRDVQEALRQALVQWLQAVAKRMRKEAGDEQDHR
jgi:transposase-like protein